MKRYEHIISYRYKNEFIGSTRIITKRKILTWKALEKEILQMTEKEVVILHHEMVRRVK